MTRRIDHLVVAVHDLEAAAGFYGRLGFQVGARNRHPWGTENRLVQFGSSFIELITVGGDPSAIPPHGPRHFSFGAFVRDYLQHREGLAMLVLDSTDAQADAALYARLGIGDFEPFFFERKARRPDGSETRVAFSLAFAADAAAPQAGFFVCQQHAPENFWNPDFQRHPNGAENIVRVVLATPDPQAHAAFLTGFTGVSPVAGGYPLDGGQIAAAPAPTPGLASFTIQIPDRAAQAAILSQAAIAYHMDDGALVVPAPAAHGVEIRFAEAAPQR